AAPAAGSIHPTSGRMSIRPPIPVTSSSPSRSSFPRRAAPRRTMLEPSLEDPMKRWFTTFAAIAVCSAALHADVTIVQTTTIEGGMMAASGQVMQPKTTNRIKGNKSRTDLDASMIQVTTIADLDSHQVIVLRPDQKTAQIVKPGE